LCGGGREGTTPQRPRGSLQHLFDAGDRDSVHQFHTPTHQPRDITPNRVLPVRSSEYSLQSMNQSAHCKYYKQFGGDRRMCALLS
jgi:hypothetical protein